MDRCIRLKWYLETLWKLGLGSLARVALYRAQIKARWFCQILLVGEPVQSPFFTGKNAIASTDEDSFFHLPASAKLLFDGKLQFFSSSIEYVGSPPDWFEDVVAGELYPDSKKHWALLSDFNAGDIKHIWEPSRLQWSVLAAQAYRVTGDEKYLLLLNSWLLDWSDKNPVNQGPNWKCGQEAAIRILNLLLAAFILKESDVPSPSLIQIVREHCARIEPTLHYAVSQNNNHGTSEAAGLYVGGGWLISVGDNSKDAKRWARLGRKMLENRVNALIEGDGSFSQYSVNYHRLLLDTLSQVEFWRRNLDQPFFSKRFYKRAAMAVEWLWQMVDSDTGRAPNLGANDGALLLQLVDASYGDFRPTVQLAGVLFLRRRCYENYEEGRGILEWLNLSVKDIPVIEKVRGSVLFGDGGFVTMHGKSCWGVLRFPRFNFRPGHADLLHLEIVDRGTSVVKDAGSYSYNTMPRWMSYFPGVSSHNTIQFDDGEPMPRLGRFLFGAWPEVKNIFFECSDENASWSGGYIDYRGCKHSRKVEVHDRMWVVEDVISGFREKAVLRWRLAPGNWVIDGNVVYSNLATLRVEADGTICRMDLVEGWESEYYEKKTLLPVLEVEVSGACKLMSQIILSDIECKS